MQLTVTFCMLTAVSLLTSESSRNHKRKCILERAALCRAFFCNGEWEMRYTNKLITLIVGAAVVIPQSACASSDTIAVYVDGARVGFDVAPVILNDRTMVPHACHL